MAEIFPEMEGVARTLRATFETRIATPTFRQIFLTRDDEILKIDLVRDIDVRFGQPRHFDAVIVDAFENIGANKINAIFGRTAVKDFVDLYFILQSGAKFDDLLAMAKQRDGGLTEFYLAGMMRQARELNRLPRMVKPLALDEMKKFFMELGDELLPRTKPPA